jgi:aquaporin Z
MNKFLAEFIGTYALVFFGTGAIIVNQEVNGVITNVGIAIIFGLIVMAMIYTLGNVSGAHINPAVSIAFAISKRLPLHQLFPYIGCQIAGGIAASLTLKFPFPLNEQLGATFPKNSITQSFILELILTFFLMLVIIKVATGSKEQGIFAGITIGSVVGIRSEVCRTHLWRFYESCPFDSAGNCIGPFETVVDIYLRRLSALQCLFRYQTL